MKRSTFGLGSLSVAALAASGARVALADGPTVNIGFTGPLSGGAAQYGTDVQHGLQLAIDHINAADKKQTFNLVSLDDQYRPNEAAINAKRLVQENNTPIIVCPHSGGILALLSFNEKQSPKFLVGAYSSEPKILQQNNGLVFMTPPRYDSYFKPWTNALLKRYGKNLGLLPTSTAYGNAWKAGFSDAWKAAGGNVLGDDAVDYNTTADFSGAVSKALSEHPDVMLVGGPSQPTALVMKAARDQGYKGGFIMMDQAKFEQVAKVLPMDRLDGTVGVEPIDKYNGPGLQAFLAAYKAKFGTEREANSEVAFNYMGMLVMARAMKLANTTSDPAAIRGKLGDAIKQLPKNEQPLTLTGITPAGHLEVNLTTELVDHGKFQQISIPALA